MNPIHVITETYASKMNQLPLPDSSLFNPIDLEASLGRIEDAKEASGNSSSPRTCQRQQMTESQNTAIRSGITRTSSKTPFMRESQSTMLKPYPISETDDEIKERNRLTEAVDWSTGLVVNTPPQSSMNANENNDQQSMMEVTVDDFVLSAEEAGSLNDLDATTIQEDPNGFWESPAHNVGSKLYTNTNNISIMASVPFSVTFSSQEGPGMADIDNDNEFMDATPIRSVDMEW